ncbi:hypothetical protein M408DRAFT_25522 [Serendipita vermifera MAFF 305830]|uniref:F-box domain-containing protein n=1 Tax=Serendipita vermifera MAFF 305830 TaxID=933852 RepID=A0A0C3B4A2_SERVB|nr:hypothetical protein M408DRAFT_25522 [Serendipita vermifera MAFF 305830]
MLDLLPPEIWAEIFTFYAQEQLNPCITLLYVCKAFRDIIMASPPCWAAMVIPCSTDPDSASIPIIDTWIERSAASPLFIFLNFEETDEQLVPLLLPSSTLLQNRSRFRVLIIYEANEGNLWNLNHLWPAPNLLSFAFMREENKSPFVYPLDLLDFPLFLRNDPQAPRLIHLLLNHCQFDAPRCDLDNVQELSLSHCTSSIRGFRQTLKCTPNVLGLVLGEVEIDAEPQIEMPNATTNITTIEPIKVLLKHVRSMELCLENVSMPIIVNLVTPCLTYLALTATVDDVSLENIYNFLAQELMPLRYLSLALRSSFSSPRVLDLPKLSQLRTLHADVHYISLNPLPVMVCPALMEFEIQIEPFTLSRHWDEFLESQSEYRFSTKTFLNRALLEGNRITLNNGT